MQYSKKSSQIEFEEVKDNFVEDIVVLAWTPCEPAEHPYDTA